MNHYETLGVPKDADKATIKKAYRRKARAAHPDQGGNHQQMVAVNRAYDVLSDEKCRENYDLGGEDDPTAHLKTEEVKAMEILWQILSAIIDNVGDNVDFVKGLRDQLSSNIATARNSVRGMEQMRTKYQKQMKRVKRKTEGQNMLLMVWEQRLATIAEKLVEATEAIKLAESAQKLLDDYESPLDPGTSAPVRTGFGQPLTLELLNSMMRGQR